MSKKRTKTNTSNNAKGKVSRTPSNTSRKKPASNNRTNVKVGNFSNFRGKLSIAGRDIVTHKTRTTFNAAEVRQLFEQLQKDIEANVETSPANRKDLKAELKEIQATVTEAAKKNEKVDESFLSRRFRNIVRMAPDVLDVVVATLANPALGLGEVAKKLAAKAKEEAKAG